MMLKNARTQRALNIAPLQRSDYQLFIVYRNIAIYGAAAFAPCFGWRRGRGVAAPRLASKREGVKVCPAAPLRFATGYRDIAPRGDFSRLSGDFCLGIAVAELYFAPQRVTETSPFQGFFAGCSRGAATKRSRKMGWGAFVTTSCAPPTGRLQVATDKILLRSIIGGYAAVRRPD